MKQHKLHKLLFLFILIGSILSCHSNLIKVPESPYPISPDSFSLDTIANGFTIPYGLAILSDDEYFITDRVGKFYHLKNDQQTEITGMPEVVTFGTPGLAAIMHGGLMDISLHPKYTTNGWIYISYLDPQGLATVARFKIRAQKATEFEPIFKARVADYTGNGMRIVWQDSTHFFLNIGNSNLSTKDHPFLFAQDFNHDAGKIHRLKADGSIPADNPILEGFVAPTTIWSYGHRDVQGLYFDTSTQTLIGVEHGPQGGDEFNIIEEGKNYGWPLFTYGINYNGASVSLISKDSAATFTVLPAHYWTVPTNYGGQAIAPACLLKVKESNISDWNDFFLIGSLAYRRLMKYNHTTRETFGLNIEGRVRTLQQLPGGDIIALIERNHLKQNNGFILRISKQVKTSGQSLTNIINVANRKEGLQQVYHDNGQLKTEGNYTENLKEGLHKEWDEGGVLLLEGFYKKGKANGIMKWYHEQGHLAAEGVMKNDIRVGKWKICDIEENGFCIDAFFENGKREGIWKIYHPHARDKLWKTQTYKNDKFIGEKCWNENGIAIACE